ncbi:FRG domain-containing protein [Cohnella lubricantis]|uniref:FRG domain-containing protein n=1 Tax=Cohnella lubricantis TaxID=2163172 RepID=UPI00315AD512
MLQTPSDWDLLYIMQHHGVRTRLLDWSESFAVSLYFAFLNWKPEETNCTVWLLDPIQLNNMYNQDFGLYMPKPQESYQHLLYNHGESYEFAVHTVALFPRRNNPRLIAQQGTFTLQGNTRLPLEEEYNGQLWERNIINRVDFNVEDYSDIEMYLRLNGMNHFTLFPDLDGLARFIMLEDTKFVSQITQEAPDIT